MRIGLTGGIACGKTRVENIFKQSGYAVFDTDRANFIIRTGIVDTEKFNDILISNNLVELVKKISEETILKLKSKLPNLYNTSGEFSRNALLNYINDDQLGEYKLSIYNQIIIPASITVYSEWHKQVQEPSLISSANIIERNNLSLVDRLYIMYISEQDQLRNLLNRQENRESPISELEARKAINRQLPFEEKLSQARAKLGKENVYVLNEDCTDTDIPFLKNY